MPAPLVLKKDAKYAQLKIGSIESRLDDLKSKGVVTMVAKATQFYEFRHNRASKRRRTVGPSGL